MKAPPAMKILGTRQTRPIRVLVVDPDDQARARCCESLSDAGCDVVDAADGRDALAKALSRRPSLVVTETVLPIFDGFALCDILRRDSATRTVPILVVTADRRAPVPDRARAAGADSILIKPVTPAALLAEIQRLLQTPPELSDTPPASSSGPGPHDSRRPLSKTIVRFETTTPQLQPPSLVCPQCDAQLAYVSSHIGGVNNRSPEQWDDYRCPAACGTFQYRHRTRRVRRL
jgi:two-component system chemotaxis response regulator CheY